jgi:hypothetical protein
MSPKIEQMMAVAGTGSALQFLGHLAFYTITETLVTRDQLEGVLVGAGLDPDLMPKPISPKDAFRVACSDAERTKVELEDGNFLNVMVREVKTDADRIVRSVVREVVNAKAERLDHGEVAHVVLSGGGRKRQGGHDDAQVQVTVLPGKALGEVEQGVVDSILAGYEKERTHYNSRAIRSMVAAILQTCDPVAVRPSGGVYFTPRYREHQVDALRRFITGLAEFSTSKTGKSSMWMVPMVDAAEHREQLAVSLEEQVVADSQALVTEMANVLRSGRKVKGDTATAYIERVKAMAKMATEYEELLETKLGNCKADLELAREQALKLLDQVAD